MADIHNQTETFLDGRNKCPSPWWQFCRRGALLKATCAAYSFILFRVTTLWYSNPRFVYAFLLQHTYHFVLFWKTARRMAHFVCFNFGNDSGSSILKSSQTSPCLDMATKHAVSGFQVLWTPQHPDSNPKIGVTRWWVNKKWIRKVHV